MLLRNPTPTAFKHELGSKILLATFGYLDSSPGKQCHPLLRMVQARDLQKM